MAMVSAGMGAMSSLLGKLSALLGDEYKLLKRVRREVELLERELRRMKALLQTLAGMDKLDALHKDWRNNVLDLSYDIEDCIDLFMQHLGMEKLDALHNAGFMKKAVRRLKALRTRHDITSQIKELKARVLEESQRRDRYMLDSSISRPTTVDIDPRLPALYAEAKGLVAIDGPRDQIVRWLMDETVELKVVSIVGCGGLGKTTLAMEVYRKIEGNFQCRASVSVSRTLDLNKLLKDVLFQIDQNEYSKCQSEMWEKEQLIRKLRHIFTGKRYLIVIDDVWRIQDWKFVESVFPENNNGSRIIVTTRITDVAKSCCSNSGDQLHQMAHLDDVDSRRLFFKRICHSDNSCPTELEKVSGQILKKCGGLPLATITIAGLLATKPQNKNEWERLQDSMGIGSSHENDHSLQGIKDILFLSYCDLPHHLKTCLLYISIYPEDYEMASLTNLVKLYIRCRNFEDEDLHVLMGLPSLIHLELELRYGEDTDDGEDTDGGEDIDDGEDTDGVDDGDDGEDIDDGEDTDKIITVGSSGFRLLEEFVCGSDYESRAMLVFAPGAAPALQRLHVNISDRETLSKYCGGAGFGIEHLTNLRHFRVQTHFCDPITTQGEIHALAATINRETTSHPNRQTLLVEIHGYGPFPGEKSMVTPQVLLRSQNGGSRYEIPPRSWKGF